jgi:hypothetical protein
VTGKVSRHTKGAQIKYSYEYVCTSKGTPERTPTASPGPSGVLCGVGSSTSIMSKSVSISVSDK